MIDFQQAVEIRTFPVLLEPLSLPVLQVCQFLQPLPLVCLHFLPY